MNDLRTILERGVGGATPPPDGFERMLRRRDRKRRNQRIAAGVVGVAVFVAAVWIVTSVGSFDRTQTPAVPGGAETGPKETGPAETGAVGAVPKTDFLLDLDTGKMTPLPESIVGTEDWTAGYAVSPDGSEVAYYGPGDGVQVFVANLDGTHVRQITSNGAATLLWSGSPGWSPDGTKIAYVGHRTGDFTGRGFVIDLASGVTTQVTSDSEEVGGIQFSPDGSSILYTTWVPSTRRGPASGPPFVDHRVRIVPLTGGEASTLVSGDRTWDGWGGPTEAGLSPDGSLLSYLCGNSSDDVLDLCVANADGSGARELASGEIMSASWSPDGTRIAYWLFHKVDVRVVDVATGVASYVTEGAHPVWLDNHTLIVEHDRCSGPAGSDGCGG
jgi:Tol biopolymer transport system component